MLIPHDSCYISLCNGPHIIRHSVLASTALLHYGTIECEPITFYEVINYRCKAFNQVEISLQTLNDSCGSISYLDCLV